MKSNIFFPWLQLVRAKSYKKCLKVEKQLFSSYFRLFNSNGHPVPMPVGGGAGAGGPAQPPHPHPAACPLPPALPAATAAAPSAEQHQHLRAAAAEAATEAVMKDEEKKEESGKTDKKLSCKEELMEPTKMEVVEAKEEREEEVDTA